MYCIYRVDSVGTIEINYERGWLSSELTDTKSLLVTNYILLSEEKAKLLFSLDEYCGYPFNSPSIGDVLKTTKV